jgi:ABC-type transport system involved in multi-copper enzyme maturation permease subunit
VLLCLSIGISGDVKLKAEGEPAFFLPPTPPREVARSVVGVLAGSGPLESAVLATSASRQVWLPWDEERNRQEGAETIRGHMTLAFGAVTVPLFRDRTEAVQFLELLLGEGLAGVLGILFALVWTAGFVPSFLDPGAASVLLAKPAARWQLLLGKYLGVLIFLAVQVTLFVVLTWFALGVRTGVWDFSYWWSIPLLLLEFAVFYSFSVLLGVVTRSTAACVVGAVLFWLLAWGINYGTVMARTTKSESGLALTPVLVEAGYWVSPKPIDAGLILFNALDARQHFQKPDIFKRLESGGGFAPALSILSSLCLAVVLFGLAAYELHARDY